MAGYGVSTSTSIARSSSVNARRAFLRCEVDIKLTRSLTLRKFITENVIRSEIWMSWFHFQKSFGGGGGGDKVLERLSPWIWLLIRILWHNCSLYPSNKFLKLPYFEKE